MWYMLGQNVSLSRKWPGGKDLGCVNPVLFEVFTLAEQVNSAHDMQNEYEI